MRHITYTHPSRTRAFSSASLITSGGSVRVSLKVLFTDKEDRGTLAAGVSAYPLTSAYGLDAGAGYLFTKSAVTLS